MVGIKNVADAFNRYQDTQKMRKGERENGESDQEIETVSGMDSDHLYGAFCSSLHGKLRKPGIYTSSRCRMPADE